MASGSLPRLLSAIEKAVHEGLLVPKTAETLRQFCESYARAAIQGGMEPETLEPFLFNFLEILRRDLKHPFTFPLYHARLRTPVDYYALGLNFVRPLIDWNRSRFLGKESVLEIDAQLKAGHNVILLANHQSELDPIGIALMLQEEFPKLAEAMISIAGERVVTDPLAVPFSKGCNLLCIYSKRYIDFPLEEKQRKQLHNTRTMEKMSELLQEGGKCIYVAPSGGRDRKSVGGRVEVAPFDPQSVEMLYLMSSRAKTPTHFYPLALSTYDLLPPPSSVQVELGEARTCSFCPMGLAFGPELDMESFPGSDNPDKRARRLLRTQHIFSEVLAAYHSLTEGDRDSTPQSSVEGRPVG